MHLAQRNGTRGPVLGQFNSIAMSSYLSGVLQQSDQRLSRELLRVQKRVELDDSARELRDDQILGSAFVLGDKRLDLGVVHRLRLPSRRHYLPVGLSVRARSRSTRLCNCCGRCQGDVTAV